MQDPRRLRVYAAARELAVSIRRASRTLPRTGYRSLQSQMVRAAESVVLNIAEGCGSSSQRELARFLEIGIKSTVELDCQLELAHEYGALREELWKRLAGEVVSVRRMLYALRMKVLDSLALPPAVQPPAGNGVSRKPETVVAVPRLDPHGRSI